MKHEHILIVDDDAPLLEAVGETLRRAGYDVTATPDSEEAVDLARRTAFDLFVLDYKMPKTNGIDLMENLRRITPSAEAIIITGYATIENGVEAIRRGACDYVVKPVERFDLQHKVDAIMERRRLRRDLARKDRELNRTYGFDSIVGVSEAMAEVRELGSRAAKVMSTVLIEGESGTGKELLARAIHFASPRAKHPFIAVNCGAVAPSIAEREFFGHARGAFTGAVGDAIGYFEASEGGTLFLDEIGEMPMDLQVKLLRVLDSQQITRVGSTQPVPVDSRILFATNRDLEAMVAEGTFRHDLFYRINVIRIQIAPLRERREDIPLLVNAFIGKSSHRLKIELKRISNEALNALSDYDWRGNARELENVIERSMALNTGESIELEHLPAWVLDEQIPLGDVDTTTDFMAARRQAQEQFDRNFLVHALQKYNGNVSQTAKAIGLARSALQRFMRKYHIDRERIPAR